MAYLSQNLAIYPHLSDENEFRALVIPQVIIIQEKDCELLFIIHVLDTEYLFLEIC